MKGLTLSKKFSVYMYYVSAWTDLRKGLFMRRVLKCVFAYYGG